MSKSFGVERQRERNIKRGGQTNSQTYRVRDRDRDRYVSIRCRLK